MEDSCGLCSCGAAPTDEADRPIDLAPPLPGDATRPPPIPSEPLEARVARALDAGVPESHAAGVGALAVELAPDIEHGEGAVGAQAKGLSDPLTLLRFLNARDGDLEQAAAMFRDTAKWRAETIDGVLAEFGQFVDTAEGDADADAWTWRAAPSTRRATLGLAHGFASVLDAPAPECELQPAGAAVAVWRISAADWNGIAREELDEAVKRGFIAHLECLLQRGRRASVRHGRLVRARLIIDVDGVGIGLLRHIGLLKQVTSMGKAYFPEVSASASVVNAPWLFTKIWAVVKPLLTPVQQRKVMILGRDFDEGLLEHAGLPRAALPAALGGETSDDQLAPAEPVPVGAGEALRSASAARAEQAEARDPEASDDGQ